MVIRTLMKKVHLAQEIIIKLVDMIDTDRTCACENALRDAILTQPDKVSPEKKQELHLLVSKYLD